jgi:NAD kinase
MEYVHPNDRIKFLVLFDKSSINITIDDLLNKNNCTVDDITNNENERIMSTLWGGDTSFLNILQYEGKIVRFNSYNDKPSRMQFLVKFDTKTMQKTATELIERCEATVILNGCLDLKLLRIHKEFAHILTEMKIDGKIKSYFIDHVWTIC